VKVAKEFYLQDDVVKIAVNLLGKKISTLIDNKLTAGIVTETEAYAGITDKASHAYNNRRTQRNEVMYHEGGVAYVYLCYGIHYLFNIVTHKKNIPHAILIRSFCPVEGEKEMLRRTGKKNINKDFACGPGKVTKALGINYSHNGCSLTGNVIWLEDTGLKINKKDIRIDKRVGIDYAQEDAGLPYRFILENIPGVRNK
jgi:DNA-3-methyladenine glycosylase